MPRTNRPTDRRGFLGQVCTLAGGLGWSACAWAERQPSSSAAEFDYVIVGAGSTGSVLANRLSADANVRVLLLEAGGPGEDDRIVQPGRWLSLLGSDVDWKLATIPQAGLGGRSIAWPSGKVFGGTSAINAMAFVRGHRADFDQWRALGNPGWAYADVLPLFKRSEDNSRGASELHGAGGPLAVSDTTDPTPAHLAFLESARQLGYGASADWDFNGRQQEDAAGFYQKNIRNGRRHSAAAAFLVPALDRPNLTALPWSLVTRVTWRGRVATGVEYLRAGMLQLARATREVILSAGVIESPKILMLSGVGPADTLRRAGIAGTADLPGVGANLHDHVRVPVVHRARREIASSRVSGGLFVRSPGVAGGSAPDLHFYFGRGIDTPSPVLTVTVALGRPASRGVVRLAGSDPTLQPTIDPAYLQSGADVTAVVAGIRLARELARSDAFSEWRGEEVEPGSDVKGDAEIVAFLRRAADTMFHPAGTCRMGSDPDAVVDSSLRVRGVEKLRVADASVMPVAVNCPTHAACVMIGEKLADLLLGSG